MRECKTGIGTYWLRPFEQSWAFHQEMMFPWDGTILIVSKFGKFLGIKEAIISHSSPRNILRMDYYCILTGIRDKRVYWQKSEVCQKSMRTYYVLFGCIATCMLVWDRSFFWKCLLTLSCQRQHLWSFLQNWMALLLWWTYLYVKWKIASKKRKHCQWLKKLR